MATIRTQRPGDLGWVFMRHAELYPKEFGYAPPFEQYVCRGLAPFHDRFEPARDRLTGGSLVAMRPRGRSGDPEAMQ